ncbi:LamG-like jellyroll fold domain-containing protein [Actinoplanes sp. NPDC049668]|uniref:LamG-like jellyroll fold domain-containing protein n=1 Tax=unclassified Actinoplanes TaxID=2626549 RepID=UPI0033AA2ED0
MIRFVKPRLASAVVSALVVTLIPALAGTSTGSPAQAAPATPAAATDPETIASLQARASGKSVEVDALGTESTRVVANPDGSFTADVHVGPSRFRGPDGAWRAVDLALEKRADGTVAPKAHPRGLVLSGAAGPGDHDLARLASGASALSLGWTGTLPDPVLSGEKATYAEVRPGIDLVVEVTRTGFEQFLVVKNRAAAAAVKNLTMPWRTDGMTPVSTPDGGFNLEDAQGRYVGHVPAAEMWDSTVGRKTGDHIRRAPVGMAVQKAARASALALAPEPDFLESPDTKYPVIIDPSPTLKPGFDAFVQNSFNSDQSSDKELKLGYVEENGTFKARSFLRWSTSAFKGKRVTAATMYLWNHWSYSCNAAKWQVWITGGVGTSTNWDRQPAWGGEGKPVVESTMTKGYGTGNCGDGWVTANVKSTFTWAAENNVSTLTTGIRATQADEDNGNQSTWKKFSSAEGAKDPYVSITYNSKPNAPTDVTIGGKSCEPGDPQVFVSRTPYYPTVQAKVSDPDGSERTLTGNFYLAEKGTAYPTSPTMSDTATNGTFASKAIRSDFGLKENVTYVLRASTADGLDTSGWSATCEFTIDSAGPAKPPTVVSSEYPECLPTVCDTAGSVGASGTFIFGANGVSDVKKFRYWFDGQPKIETALVSGTDVRVPVRVAPPPLPNALHIEDFGIGGQRVLHVESVDQAGRSSAEYRSLVQPDEAVGYNMLVGTAQNEVARWRMDDPAGTTMVDSSGNNRDLTISGGVTKTNLTKGDGGTAFTFDGTTGRSTVPDFLDIMDNHTVSADVRISSDKSVNRVIFRHSVQRGSRQAFFFIFYATGFDRWCAQRSEVTRPEFLPAPTYTWTSATTVCSGVPVLPSVSTNLTATFDGSRSTLDLYVNGVKASVSSTARAAVPLQPWPSEVSLGAGSWKGEIDDVRVWSRTLHPEEIAAGAVTEAGRWELDGNGLDMSSMPAPRDLEDPAINDEWWLEVGHLESDPGSARFDGTRSLAAAPSPIRTDQSFTVASWVNLSKMPNGNRTVVAQDGVNRSGFYLGVRGFGTAGFKWSFSLIDGDTTASSPMVHAEGASPLVDEDIGSWVHLVGVYDAAAGQIRLYVDGVLAKSIARPARWNAAGALTVGRSRWYNTAPYNTDFLSGSVDATRVYAGALTPSLVARLHDTMDGQL